MIFRYFIAWKRRIKLIELKKMDVFRLHQSCSNTDLLWVALLRVRSEDSEAHDLKMVWCFWCNHVWDRTPDGPRSKSWAIFRLILEWFSSSLSFLGENLMLTTCGQHMFTAFLYSFPAPAISAWAPWAQLGFVASGMALKFQTQEVMTLPSTASNAGASIPKPHPTLCKSPTQCSHFHGAGPRSSVCSDNCLSDGARL